VNSSFSKGDKGIGKLTSHPFTVNRKYLNLKIGGGDHKDKTSLNLLKNGEVIVSLTGSGLPHDKLKGPRSYLLNESIDLTEYYGEEISIQIMDNHPGRWGVIYVDHIILSNKRANSDLLHTFTIDRPYLLFPVKRGSKEQRVVIDMDNEFFDAFNLQIPEEEPDFYTFLDLTLHMGKRIEVHLPKLENQYIKSANAIRLADEVPGFDSLYQEKLRPGFHYTARRGWLSDPNGLVYHEGIYHMYYQHNPVGWYCHNMHWGHAISKDLIHWEEQPIALYPHSDGDYCYSGSTVVDFNNTSGFQKGNKPPIVGAFTSPGRGECVIYSNDGGKTFTEYEGNPVLSPFPRVYDPGITWYEPGKHWVMASHMTGEYLAIHTSDDLKEWTYQSKVHGFHSCQHIYPLAAPDGRQKWIINGMSGEYMIGDFDGKVFTPETELLQLNGGTSYVAAQSFNNAPNDRHVFFAFTYNGPIPDMPFNMCMLFPVEHKLKETKYGLRLCPKPIEEIENLHDESLRLENKTVEEINVALKRSAITNTGEIHIKMKMKHVEDVFEMQINGAKIILDPKRDSLVCKGELKPPVGPFANAGTPWKVRLNSKGEAIAPLDMEKDIIELEILLDKTTIEIFGNGGALYMPVSFYFHPDLLAGVFGWPNKKYEPITFIDPDKRGIELRDSGQGVEVLSLELHSMKSMWDK
jgi:fructan beta-fructosidase